MGSLVFFLSIACAVLFFLCKTTYQDKLDIAIILQKTRNELQKAEDKSARLERESIRFHKLLNERDQRLDEIQRKLEHYFPAAFLKEADKKDIDWGWRVAPIQRFLYKLQKPDVSSFEHKTNQQIGLDYERSVAHEYQVHGYTVDHWGSRLGYQDMGIDLVAKRDGKTVLIQCKYWAYDKMIHENVICQLKGSLDFYVWENRLSRETVQARLVTNICLSTTAKKVADALGIVYCEEHEKIPAVIKCLCLWDADEKMRKVYYLPDDPWYDMIQPDERRGECWAYSEEAAQQCGFQHVTDFQTSHEERLQSSPAFSDEETFSGDDEDGEEFPYFQMPRLPEDI